MLVFFKKKYRGLYGKEPSLGQYLEVTIVHVWWSGKLFLTANTFTWSYGAYTNASASVWGWLPTDASMNNLEIVSWYQRVGGLDVGLAWTL